MLGFCGMCEGGELQPGREAVLARVSYLADNLSATDVRAHESSPHRYCHHLQQFTALHQIVMLIKQQRDPEEIRFTSTRRALIG